MKKTKFILFFIFIITIALIAKEPEESEESKDKNFPDKIALDAMSNPAYLVTVGDIYSLSFLAGSRPVDYKIVVDASYKIRVANLGELNAKGLTFYQLKNRVENIVVKNYPFSGVQFIILSVGSFPVYITGEVKTNAQVTVSAMSRLDSVIKPFLTNYSSIRDVEITIDERKKEVYDIFLVGAKGDFSQNPYLRPNSKIKINRLKRKVTLSGAVERPGVYQLLDGEQLNDLINVYGKGFEEFADTTKLSIKRYSRTDDNALGNSITITSEEEIKNFELKNNDIVYVKNMADLRSVVYFEGSLNSKASIITFEFLEGDDLVSMLREKRKLFSSMSDTKNAYLMRNGEKIYENFNRIFFDPSYNEKILLEPNDRIVVPYLQQTVTVLGAVLRPGSYPYAPGKTYEYYIGLAGGFDKNRNLGSAVKIEDAAGNKMKKYEHILPNSTITAKANSFLYNFGRYVPLITTTISIISITLTIIAFTRGYSRM